ncbi:MAG: ImmA/IrrE family metallo-endopeptidase [Ruminococcus sp.]|nr:ImmA/IrrE family metallo-endopeptidase [Ruminococcus sp.]MDE6539821.1 ImmA/IrrE family metallo-endopeptidase [Ruminococcus sp.]
MKYDIYKNARDASWKFLIKYGVSSFPVNLKPIVSEMGITVRKDIIGLLSENELGRVVNAQGDLHIILRDTTTQQKRYTIAHEIGHIVLGHTEISFNPYLDEYAAERFAIGILAPACVLWGLDIHSAEDIAKICNISLSSAKIRAERMAVLYKRNKFLTSPLERQVFEQFSDFIKKNRK